MGSKGYNEAGRISVYDPALNSTYTSGLWKTAPLQEYLHNPLIGTLLDENFVTYNATDEYTLTQAVTGTAAMSTAAPGVLEIDSNSVTVVQGVNLQRNIGCTCFIPAAGKHIWAEFRFKVVDAATSCEFFVGLSETDTAILDTSAMASTNCIAFWCVTDDGVMLFGSEKAGTGTTTTSATLVEDTYVNVGFYVNGVTSVEGYYNGASVGTAHATAYVPIVAMFPSFVCQSSGTTDPIMHVQGYRIFQLN
jgi:hypothetical protein